MPNFEIPGPEGSKVVQLEPDHFPEISRLVIFLGDLKIAQANHSLAADDKRPAVERDACFLAALVKFLGCFESSGVRRRKPLQHSVIYSKDERIVLDELRVIRNKIAVHDEELYESALLAAVVTPQGSVDSVWGMNLSFAAFQLGGHLPTFGALINGAVEWVEAEILTECAKATDALNADPAALASLGDAGPFSLRFVQETEPEARWKRPNLEKWLARRQDRKRR